MLRIICGNEKCMQEYITKYSNFETRCGFCGSDNIKVKLDLRQLEPDIKSVVARLLRDEGSWVVQ